MFPTPAAVAVRTLLARRDQEFNLSAAQSGPEPQPQPADTVDDQDELAGTLGIPAPSIGSYKSFPQRFGFYNVPYSISIFQARDIAIARDKNAAASSHTRDSKLTLRPKLFARDTPWLTLHDGSSSRDPSLAVIVQRPYIQDLVKVTVAIRPIVIKGKSNMVCTEERYDAMEWKASRLVILHFTKDPCYEFSCITPHSGEGEKFQWEVCDEYMDGLEQGEKYRLVRTKTNEIVAGWSRPRGLKCNAPKLGKMGFFGSWKTLGQDFEILAVMSAVVMILIEKNTWCYDRGCGGVLGRAHLPSIPVSVSLGNGNYRTDYTRICC